MRRGNPKQANTDIPAHVQHSSTTKQNDMKHPNTSNSSGTVFPGNPSDLLCNLTSNPAPQYPNMSATHGAPPNAGAYRTPADVLARFSHYVHQPPHASHIPDYSSVPIKTHPETSGVAPYMPFRGKATSPALASGDVPADYSLGWNDGRLEKGYVQDLNRTSTAQAEVDSLRRRVYHDRREHRPEATLACKFGDEEIASLKWNNGKQGHPTSRWYDEAPHAWLRNDAVDGTFPTPNRTLHIEQTLANVAEIEQLLHPDIVARIVEQAREEKEDWNAYLEQYYRIVSSDAVPLGVSTMWISVLLVLAAHVRHKLKSRPQPIPAILPQPIPAHVANKARVYLSKVDDNINSMYAALLQRKKGHKEKYEVDCKQQNSLDHTKRPLHTIKTVNESYNALDRVFFDSSHPGWTSTLAQERLPLRFQDRGIKPTPELVSKQEAMSREGLLHHAREVPRYGMGASDSNVSYFQSNVALHGANPNRYEQVSRIPEMWNVHENKEHFFYNELEALDFPIMKKYAEDSKRIDEEIRLLLQQPP